ncbi:hypothetical protein BGZ51_008945 [Haplosporangium sp. Z 767]|nr:hypothetical protein BGZ51_008945 [Haplosporangium sp. Z 767]KAF9196575.1 hypothetical protein BGZ50_009090 [Haplosporangium sp. Z 11]
MHSNNTNSNSNNNSSNYINPSPLVMSPTPDTRSVGNKQTGTTGTPHFPEPIVFQYTLYYPGNIPLAITAGHGGASRPGYAVSRRMTHRFKPIPDLDTTMKPIQVSMFAEPTTRMNNYEGSEEEEIMPWMPARSQPTDGPVSNFKADLNTHAMALNLANAVACLSSVSRNGMESHGYDRVTNVAGSSTAIPEKCEDQNPWGDNDSDYPFPPPPAPSAVPTLPFVSQVALDASPVNPKQKQPRQYQQQLNYPHVIVFRVRRLYVDVNRNLTGENAIAEGHPVAEAAWREYHDLIDHIKKMALQQRRQQQQSSKNMPRVSLSSIGDGLLLDIHGHAHATNLIEVGYLLDHTVLEMSDDDVDAHAPALIARSSIRALTTRLNLASSHIHDYNQHESQKCITFSKLIRGRTESLGGMLQTQGLSSVPSPEHPAPHGGSIYFYGGYTIQRHGSRNASNINNKSRDNNDKQSESCVMDAIQLELPKTLRLVPNEEGREIGMKLGRAVVGYMAKYYGIFQGLEYANGSDTMATEAVAAKTKMSDEVGTWTMARQYTRPSKVHDTPAEARENQSGDSDSESGSLAEVDSGAKTGPAIPMKSTASRKRPEVERRSSRL